MPIDQKLRVLIDGNATGLNKALTTTSTRLNQFGTRLQSIGTSLSTRLTLPIALAGAAAIKMAVDFDKSMTQIKTLVGLAGNEVDTMSVKVKQLAQTTGKSASEAAEAMFFITSAGLRGAEAMEVLEQSLKASVLGLGETKIIADLATSAMNAYGSDVLGASDATDVLVSAVREGKLQAEELSAVMGQVLPVASNMGVAFHEVGGAFAAMSRTGTPAAQAATQLNAILSALLKTTPQAEKALNQLGLSSAGLKNQIKEEGLLSVLKTLKNASEQNEDAFLRVFGSIRAVKGVLDLTGKSAGTTSAIMNSMANSAGTTAEAYEKVQKSASFKLSKTLNDLKFLFTEVGTVLLTALIPALTKVGKFLVDTTNIFNSLNPKIKNLILILGGVAIAIGPVIMVLGTFIKSVGFISSGVMTAIPVITKLGVALKILGTIALTNPIGIIVTAVSALTIGLIELLHRLNPAVSRIQTFFNAIKSGGNFVTFNNLQMQTTAKNLAREKEERAKLNQEIKTHTDNVKFNNSAYQELGNTINTSVAPALRKVSTLETNLKPLGLVNVGANVKPTADTSGMSNLANNQTSEQAPFITTLQQGVILTDLLTQSFQNLGSGGNFFEPIIQHIKQLVIKLVAATAAAAVLNAIMGGGASGFSSMFSQFSGIPIKKMANGGIVSAPTMGLMGEYSGAKSNPEVVAPLDKLKTMIGTTGSQNVQVGGEFKIKGQDLVVAVQRATNQRNRIK